ncbi:hypothetical protein N8I77_007250 [Diaporthe amygdali]|uniref:Rhodopsin domain-containing protein n=1 Tax=Phomopsis amygdali TaxID=1214568 RepID=A0AAD9SBN0_PHOAM|nr:hypothetical protein N8I77_007250 [Diaporthe amygdali]
MNMSSASLDPSQVPVLTPPAGVIPNFIDADTRAPLVRSIACVALAVMLVFMTLRIYTRLKIIGSFDSDDYLCVAAAAAVIAYTGIILSTITDTLGRHLWNVPMTAITLEYVTGSLLSFIMYSIAAVFVKTTLLVFYLRVFRPSYRANILAWSGIVAIALFHLISIVILLVNCIPVDQQLPGSDPTKWADKKNNRCGQPNLDISAAQAGFSAVTDIYVLAIPISSVLALQLQTKKKLGVLAIFLTGLFSCACSIASAYIRFAWQKSGKGDYTWDNTLPYVFGTIELNVGIICSCLPVTFVVFKGLSMRATVTSFVRYIRSKGKGKRDAPLDPAGARDSSSSLAKDLDDYVLPKIPRATMTGLRTFIGRPNSHVSPYQCQSTTFRPELTIFDELTSSGKDPHYEPQQCYQKISYADHSDPIFMYHSHEDNHKHGRAL